MAPLSPAPSIIRNGDRSLRPRRLPGHCSPRSARLHGASHNRERNAPWPPPPGRRETGDPQRRLLTACQWLWVLDSSVRAARQREPVPQHDLDLLRAIPVNALPPRQLPGPADPVGALCEGAIASAERVRHLAWVSAEQASWSPNMTVTSLRRIAGASTVTSHNCALLLQSLAARTEHSGFAEISAGLSAAADSAGRARDHWLHVARTVGQITTDTRARLSQAASEASDLALWTGRLAYADPEWTPARGPAHQARSPASLAPTPADVPPVVAAVHHALETVPSSVLPNGSRSPRPRMPGASSCLPAPSLTPISPDRTHRRRRNALTSCSPSTAKPGKSAVRPQPRSVRSLKLSARPARYSTPREPPSRPVGRTGRIKGPLPMRNLARGETVLPSVMSARRSARCLGKVEISLLRARHHPARTARARSRHRHRPPAPQQRHRSRAEPIAAEGQRPHAGPSCHCRISGACTSTS